MGTVNLARLMYHLITGAATLSMRIDLFNEETIRESK